MYRNLLCLLCLVAALGLVGDIRGTAAAPKEKGKPPTLDKDPHLVGWWKFDDASGRTAVDSSGHGRKGTLKGKLSFDKASVPGRTGKALRLTGTNDCVEILGYKGVAGAQTRTVAAWIKTKRSKGEIVSWGAKDFGQMCTLGFIRGRVGLTPHGGYLYMNAPVHDDKWRHVAMVVAEADRPNLHDDVKLYLDGAPAEIHDIGLLDLWPLDTGKELDVRIGSRFKGVIDDLRIYDRALSDEEIGALFKLQSDKPLAKP